VLIDHLLHAELVYLICGRLQMSSALAATLNPGTVLLHVLM